MDLKFTKWVGAGNDFILVDWRKETNLPAGEWVKLAQKLCDRKWGIGADGLLVLEASEGADFRMRIFNPDGSEAEMCGNASRCAAAYAAGGEDRQITFDALAGRLEAEVKGDLVKVKLMEPHSFKKDILVDVDGVSYSIHSITVGVPHAIIFSNHLEGIDVEGIGEKIRHHLSFKPRGTNVDFVEAKGQNAISVRTYERGVEGETLACGTGATASALVASLLSGFSSPITVLTKGGEELKIYFRRDGDTFREVYLEGKVTCIFEGRAKDV